MKDYIKIARPDHWIKNFFILPGVIMAILLTSTPWIDINYFNILLGLIATCFIASANYVINEWLDAEFDKFHPTKKNRPVVSSNMKFHYVMLEYLILAAAGIGLSFMINLLFVGSEVWLLVMGILYNVKPIRTKDIIYLDVLSESVNNLIRFLIGWFTITRIYLPPSSILLGYWMVGAFLMSTKRLAEYRMIGDSQLAGKYRKSFSYYSERSLLGSSFFYALSASFFIGVFLIKYRIEYLLTVPVMFVAFSYYIMLAYNEDSAVQKPEKLYKEKKLMFLMLLFVIMFVLMTFIEIPQLHKLISDKLIQIGP